MPTTPTRGFQVGRDDDRFGDVHSLGIGTLSFKVSTEDSQGALLIVELVHHTMGGPPRHLHRDQDEAFYVVEGEYIVEVGQERFRLRPGDSAFSAWRATCVGLCGRAHGADGLYRLSSRSAGSILP